MNLTAEIGAAFLDELEKISSARSLTLLEKLARIKLIAKGLRKGLGAAGKKGEKARKALAARTEAQAAERATRGAGKAQGELMAAGPREQARLAKEWEAMRQARAAGRAPAPTVTHTPRGQAAANIRRTQAEQAVARSQATRQSGALPITRRDVRMSKKQLRTSPAQTTVPMKAPKVKAPKAPASTGTPGAPAGGGTPQPKTPTTSGGDATGKSITDATQQGAKKPWGGWKPLAYGGAAVGIPTLAATHVAGKATQVNAGSPPMVNPYRYR